MEYAANESRFASAYAAACSSASGRSPRASASCSAASGSCSTRLVRKSTLSERAQGSTRCSVPIPDHPPLCCVVTRIVARCGLVPRKAASRSGSTTSSITRSHSSPSDAIADSGTWSAESSWRSSPRSAAKSSTAVATDRPLIHATASGCSHRSAMRRARRDFPTPPRPERTVTSLDAKSCSTCSSSPARPWKGTVAAGRGAGTGLPRRSRMLAGTSIASSTAGIDADQSRMSAKASRRRPAWSKAAAGSSRTLLMRSAHTSGAVGSSPSMSTTWSR